MLHIENIDAYSVRFGDAYGGGTYTKVLPKTLEASKDEINRINIYHTDKEEQLLHHYDVSDIRLNGTTYATAALFVAAFNAAMDSETAFTTTTTTRPITTTTTTRLTTTTTTRPVTTTTTTAA